MGASLLTTNRVAIGFNKDMAWTHTVSTAKRFTYQLTLNPRTPTNTYTTVNTRHAETHGNRAGVRR